MQPTRRVHHPGYLARLQRKGRLLKRLLHVAVAKDSEVTTLPGTAAIGLGHGQLAQGDLAALDTLLVSLDDLAGVVFGAGDLGLFCVAWAFVSRMFRAAGDTRPATVSCITPSLPGLPRHLAPPSLVPRSFRFAV